MKIAYVSEKYNWDSYSLPRLLYERLEQMPQHEVQFFFKEYVPKECFKPDVIFAVGNGAKVEYPNDSAKIVRIAMSDPNLFSRENYENCDFYFTNDEYNDFKLWYETQGLNNNICYLPAFSDSLYFNEIVDSHYYHGIFFIGDGVHKYVTDRIQIVEGLRERGIRIHVFGNRWPEHEDNHDFISGKDLVSQYVHRDILLDLSNRTTSVSSRIFQSSICGTPVLTCKRDDVSEMFKENEEIFFYRHDDNIEKKIDNIYNKIISIGYSREIDRFVYYGTQGIVGRKAKERCLLHHQTRNRIETIFEHLERIL